MNQKGSAPPITHGSNDKLQTFILLLQMPPPRYGRGLFFWNGDRRIIGGRSMSLKVIESNLTGARLYSEKRSPHNIKKDHHWQGKKGLTILT
jgi:hypothetical protein